MTDAYSKAAVGYERIREVLDTDGEVKDLPGARRAPRFQGQHRIRERQFQLRAGNSRCSRTSASRSKPGQVAALVGPTGAGKTTIISLIPRFYDPDVGRREDRRPRTCGASQQKSLRQQISFVLQETLLFHGPIWYNIAYGKPEASRAEILRAAELANAHEFIEKMPEGYDTMVGERGVTLSGRPAPAHRDRARDHSQHARS